MATILYLLSHKVLQLAILEDLLPCQETNAASLIVLAQIDTAPQLVAALELQLMPH